MVNITKSKKLNSKTWIIYSSLCLFAVPAQRSPAVRLKDSVPSPQVRDSTTASMEDFPCKDQTVHSYQQISCLDSVIRYGS